MSPLRKFLEDRRVDESQLLTGKRASTFIGQELAMKPNGFTLVEIIIVLAIVGLIFVIIFLAVSAAQRGQRDTARKDNVNRLVAAAQQYAGNNNGQYPTVSTSVFPSGWTKNSPITAVSNSAPTDTKTLGWVSSLTGCTAFGTSSNGGTNAYVGVILDDGATKYCKDY